MRVYVFILNILELLARSWTSNLPIPFGKITALSKASIEGSIILATTICPLEVIPTVNGHGTAMPRSCFCLIYAGSLAWDIPPGNSRAGWGNGVPRTMPILYTN